MSRGSAHGAGGCCQGSCQRSGRGGCQWMCVTYTGGRVEGCGYDMRVNETRVYPKR